MLFDLERDIEAAKKALSHRRCEISQRELWRLAELYAEAGRYDERGTVLDAIVVAEEYADAVQGIAAPWLEGERIEENKDAKTDQSDSAHPAAEPTGA